MFRQQKWLIGLVALLALVAAGLVAFTPGSTTPEAQTGTGPQLISPDDYVSRFQEGDSDSMLIDVRTPGEYNSGHIAGSVNIPVDDLQRRLSQVPQNQPIIVYCRSGNRSAQAASILADAGYPDVYDLGGIITWEQQGYPVQ